MTIAMDNQAFGRLGLAPLYRWPDSYREPILRVLKWRAAKAAVEAFDKLKSATRYFEFNGSTVVSNNKSGEVVAGRIMFFPLEFARISEIRRLEMGASTVAVMLKGNWYQVRAVYPW